jgi:aminoglycoside phosphotransferase (APT) family kinase protein
MNGPPSPQGQPPAEAAIDEALVRALLKAQHPDLAGRTIVEAGSGWDNAVFRLGRDLAARLPRRAAAAHLALNEMRWLPMLARRLPLPTPAPRRSGRPQGDYPWAWSIVPWIEGETADIAPPGPAEGARLGAFFEALHRPAPDEAPVNPYRGVPLTARADAFEARLATVRPHTDVVGPAVMETWAQAVAAPTDGPPTWIHGDPHPRNILVRNGRLAGVLDWGDMAAGDRASDLAGVWLILPQIQSRRAAIAACPTAGSAAWRRARGWAALYALMLLEAGLAGDARMGKIGEATLRRLEDGP